MPLSNNELTNEEMEPERKRCVSEAEVGPQAGVCLVQPIEWCSRMFRSAPGSRGAKLSFCCSDDKAEAMAEPCEHQIGDTERKPQYGMTK
jgi:hypothetical protein